MSLLAAAIRNLCRDLTIEKICTITDVPQGTGYAMKSEAMRGVITRWNGPRLERLSAWERNTYGTWTLADALKGEESEPMSLEDIRKLAEALQHFGATIETVSKAIEDQKVTHPEWEAILADGMAAQQALNLAVRLARKRVTEPRR